jgi:hypothetical protein
MTVVLHDGNKKTVPLPGVRLFDLNLKLHSRFANQLV